jgi:hypothetical protein
VLIEEIDERNFKEKVEEGEARVRAKLKRFDRQIEELKNYTRSNFQKPSIDWFRFLDPTIFAYKFLTTKQGKPLILRGFQDKIINDKHPYIVCAAANQMGKTWTACVKALHHALFVPNASVLIVSKSEQQAIMILDEISWMMRRANIPFDSVIDEVENRTELHITNYDKKGVSVIRCLPPTTRVLAYPATLIICDEVGFWEIDRMDSVDFFERVIVSRTLETREQKVSCNGVDLNNFFTMGQIFAISNPNAQQGILWYLWNNPKYHQYRYNWLAKVGRTLEEYEKEKRSTPSHIFDSVYAAVFSSPTGGFITLDEYRDATRNYPVFPPPDTPICLGGDFAGEDTSSREVDSTVLFGGIKVEEDKKEKVKIVYFKEFPPKTKKTVVYDEISRIKNILRFSYDKVGVGDSVKNDLIDRKILSEYQIESLTYSLPNKSEVYYNLKHLFEQRKIIIPDVPKLREQLLSLRFEKTEGGHIKVHHPDKGKIHDDWADALANCVWAVIRSSAVPVELEIVRSIEEKEEPEKKNKGTLVYCKNCDDFHWGKCDAGQI